MNNKFLSVLLASVLTVSAMGLPGSVKAAGTQDVQQPMVLRYDEPANSTYTAVGGASKWEAASLPIGNGVLGANVFGEVGEELLTINEETLWSGGRGSVDHYDGGNPDPAAARNAYDTISNKLLNNQSLGWNEMENLRGDPKDMSGYDDGYQPLGNLKFSFSHRNQTNYERTLDLDRGLATVCYTSGGVNYTREYFASNPDNVIVAHFTADGSSGKNRSWSRWKKQAGNLSFTVGFESQQGNAMTTSVSGNTGYLTISGAVANNGLLHNTQIPVVADGGSVSDPYHGEIEVIYCTNSGLWAFRTKVDWVLSALVGSAFSFSN